MNKLTERSMEPGEIAGAFRRNRGKVALFLIAVCVVTAVAAIFLPRQYASESQLFVRVGRESVGLDPTATTGQTMTIQTTREVEVQSVLQLLRSRGLLEKVVERIGAEKLLENPNPNWLTNAWDEIGAAKARLVSMVSDGSEVPPEVEQREQARELLERSVDISVAKNSTVITVDSRAATPELAQEITSTLVDAYLEEHARIHHTEGSEAFFAEQADRVGAELRATLSQLRDTKNEHSLVTIEGQLNLLESEKADIEKEQLRTARLIAESESTCAGLRRALNGLDEEVLAVREQRPSLASDNMREQLYQLEMQEQELRTRYKPEHPLMVAMTAQLEGARKIQEDLDEFRTEPTYTINPTRQKIEHALLEEESQLASLEAVERSLQDQATALVKRLQEVNDQALVIEELDREAQLLGESYASYSENLEQARIDGALQRQQITNVNIAQPASLSHRPVSPRLPILAALGLVVAVGGSFGLALGSERLDQRLWSPDQVEADLEIPVLMTLPRLSQRGTLATVLPEKK